MLFRVYSLENQGRKKPNKHKQLFGIVPEMGGGQICLCVALFSWGERETHKQNSQEMSGKCQNSPGIIPGQSRDIVVYVFLVDWFFSFTKKKENSKKSW